MRRAPKKLYRATLNHLYNYANEDVSVQHLSLIPITSILTTIYSLKNCSIYERSCRIYSPKSSGIFRKEFRYVKKDKYVIYQLRVGPYGEKLWPQSWKCCPRDLPAGKYIFFNGITALAFSVKGKLILSTLTQDISWSSSIHILIQS